MPSWDHVVEAANDFAFAKAMASTDGEGQARNNRRRFAAAAWIPGAILVAYLAGSQESWAIAVVGFGVLLAGMYVYAERPRFGRKS